MLWFAAKIGVNKRLLVLATARCAETVKHLMKDERSIKAVEVAIQYGLGNASEEELEKARKEALDAAYDAYAATATANRVAASVASAYAARVATSVASADAIRVATAANAADIAIYFDALANSYSDKEAREALSLIHI